MGVINKKESHKERYKLSVMVLMMRRTPTAVQPRRMPRMAGKSSKESLGFAKWKPAL